MEWKQQSVKRSSCLSPSITPDRWRTVTDTGQEETVDPFVIDARYPLQEDNLWYLHITIQLYKLPEKTTKADNGPSRSGSRGGGYLVDFQNGGLRCISITSDKERIAQTFASSATIFLDLCARLITELTVQG
jgi:hypothetical protein